MSTEDDLPDAAAKYEGMGCLALCLALALLIAAGPIIRIIEAIKS